MTEGQTNYVQYLLAVFETGSRILEAKLPSRSLRKGSTEYKICMAASRANGISDGS